jgi:hypothetical protein
MQRDNINHYIYFACGIFLLCGTIIGLSHITNVFVVPYLVDKFLATSNDTLRDVIEFVFETLNRTGG